MSQEVTLRIETDEETKKQAQKTARELNIPLSVVINNYLKQFVRTKEVHFSSAPRISKKLEKTIEEAERDRAEGTVSPAFSSAEEMDTYLDSDED